MAYGSSDIAELYRQPLDRVERALAFEAAVAA